MSFPLKKFKKKLKSYFSTFSYLLSYSFIRLIGWPISRLSYKNIHRIGKCVGLIAYYSIKTFRKRVYSNLAIAHKLATTKESRSKICKETFQNLAITSFEFFRLKRKPGKLSGITVSYNSEQTQSLLKQGQGVILLIGHMANWEIPFIEITREFAGIAIGKPLKNPFLNKWILSVREMNKGRIVYPRNALSSGLKELKQGRFLGIVGDQALPESSYSYPFLGVRAWTSSSPALLAYKTGCPIIVGSLHREDYKYHIVHSDPIWPNLDNPLKQEVIRLMDQCMTILEESVLKHPGQWLWQHDRWKQSGINHVKRCYRHGFILIILSEPYIDLIALFQEIYPKSFLTFAIPESVPFSNENGLEILRYNSKQDLLVNDWRYQFIVDLTNTSSVTKHFKKLGAFKTINLAEMQQKAKRKGKEELLSNDKLSALINFNLCK